MILGKGNDGIWRSHFESLSQMLENNKRSARVLVWRFCDIADKFHDRYLLMELGSFSIGKGFSVEREDFWMR